MSPTVFKVKGYRFFFFSREEDRMHIHVHCSDGEGKYWLEPKIEICKNYSLSNKHLTEIESIIEERYDEIRSAWQQHFGN